MVIGVATCRQKYAFVHIVNQGLSANVSANKFRQTTIRYLGSFTYIWVRSRRCGRLVTWFCYKMIAKPGNKTAAPSWPDPYPFHLAPPLRLFIHDGFLFQLDQPSLGMPSPEYFLKEQDALYKDAYLRFMINVAVLLGADREEATREMQNVLDFEIKLANVSLLPVSIPWGPFYWHWSNTIPQWIS